MKEKLLFESLKLIAGIFIREGFKICAEVVPQRISKLVSWWQGKTIAVIGATASGKNSMFRQLAGAEPPKEHIQTRGAEKVDSFKVRRSVGSDHDIEFWCRNAVNIGGEIDERERYWRQSCEDADFIFYLVDLQRYRVDKDAAQKRIRADFKWLARNISTMKSGRKVYVLLNKIDLCIDGYDDIDDIKAYLLSAVKEECQELRTMLLAAFGDNAGAFSGISPISMMDPGIFNQFFDAALMDIYFGREQT